MAKHMHKSTSPSKTKDAIAPLITRAMIRDALRRLGVRAGDIVLAHSSMKSFGRVRGGPDAVIGALLDCVGRRGTLLLPTFTGTAAMDAAHPPVFDARRTPGWTGLISEVFRARPDVIRSLHPTHSVAAWGADADALIEGHEFATTPCGWETPFGRLIRRGGKVLFLGADLESCTLFHSFEEFADVPYHIQREFVDATVIDAAGRKKIVRIKLHWWNPAAPRKFGVLEPLLARKRILRKGRVGNAVLRLLDARRCHEITMPLLGNNPLLLVASPTT